MPDAQSQKIWQSVQLPPFPSGARELEPKINPVLHFPFGMTRANETD